MIAVIADDLTGAAEIGGIGLKHGFNVEINTSVNPASNAGLLVINTDTRSKSRKEAIETVTAVCVQLQKSNPAFIYKKIDSIMRGHVLAEVEAALAALQLPGALIIPANPHLGRTLVNKTYLIKGVPVHKTSFANDPEFPVKGATVDAMLHDTDSKVAVKKHIETLPDAGIVVGEVEHADDLQQWAKLAKPKELLVGAAGFFSALLDKNSGNKNNTPVKAKTFGQPVLYVSGTTFSGSADTIQQLYDTGGPVSYMPQSILNNQENFKLTISHWVQYVCKLLKQHGKAVIAIDQQLVSGENLNADSLRRRMALAVKCVFEQATIHEMVIEGGATAAAILKHFDYDKLLPVEELAPGVIRSKVAADKNLYVTLKPGSYNWSEKIWKF
jgi:uncharacterized protein YgbK (DUF1537 family)